MNLARENVGDSELVVTSDGRLSYFFPVGSTSGYARTCGELEGTRFFSFLIAGESLVLAQTEGQPLEPLGWVQCEQPRLELVGEQEGIYAAYVVGGPPARAPTAEDCRITSAPGHLNDAVFGSDLGYGSASDLVTRALAVGFQGARIERTGCSTFRVVVTASPTIRRSRPTSDDRPRASASTSSTCRPCATRRSPAGIAAVHPDQVSASRYARDVSAVAASHEKRSRATHALRLPSLPSELGVGEQRSIAARSAPGSRAGRAAR